MAEQTLKDVETQVILTGILLLFRKRKQRHGKRTKINRWLKDCCSEESFGVFDYSEVFADYIDLSI